MPRETRPANDREPPTLNCLEKYRKKLITGINRDLGVIVERPATGAVHDFRVGIKRLTALYHLLGEIDPGVDSKRLLMPYRGAFKRIGNIRDAHIAIDLVANLDGIDTQHRRLLVGALESGAARDYRLFQQDIMRTHQSSVRMPSIRSSGISERAILRCKPIVLRHLLDRILDSGHKMDARLWHKKRILLKRYHHILDAFCFCPGHRLDETEIKQIRMLEQLLGDWHDRVVAAELIWALPGAEASQSETIRIIESQERLLLGSAKIYLHKFARWHGGG